MFFNNIYMLFNIIGLYVYIYSLCQEHFHSPITSNLKYKIWVHRPSIKGTKPLFIVIKVIIHAKKTHISVKELCVSARDPYIFAKEPSMKKKSPVSPQKSCLSLQRSCLSLQKSSLSLQKRPIFPHKSPGRGHTGSHAQHAVTQCHTLQHTATHCNTLQHAASHCRWSLRQRVVWWSSSVRALL